MADSPRPRTPVGRRSGWWPALTVTLALMVLGTIGWFVLGLGPLRPAPRPSSPPTACVATPAASQRDIDPTDDPEFPWPHTPGRKITVYFQTHGLPARYATLVQQAASIWSASPCISAVAVDICPTGSNCTSIVTKRRSRDSDTDGESSGDDQNGVRRADTITLYTNPLDKETDNGALATIVHEMGHALGLVHRLDRNDVMNADTNDNTNPIPDAVDFTNLVVIYGGGTDHR